MNYLLTRANRYKEENGTPSLSGEEKKEAQEPVATSSEIFAEKQAAAADSYQRKKKQQWAQEMAVQEQQEQAERREQEQTRQKAQSLDRQRALPHYLTGGVPEKTPDTKPTYLTGNREPVRPDPQKQKEAQPAEPPQNNPFADGQIPQRTTQTTAMDILNSPWLRKSSTIGKPDYTTMALQQAQNELEAYRQTDEYKARSEEKRLQDLFSTLPGATNAAQPISPATGLPEGEEKTTANPVDAKYLELQSKVDYWKNVQQQEEDAKTTADNLATIASWPEEDQQALNDYVNYRFKDTVYAGSSNLFKVLYHQSKTKDQRAETARLVEKYGKSVVEQLAETLEWVQTAEEAQQLREAGAHHGESHPYLSSAASVPVNVMSGITSIYGLANDVINRTGQYNTLNPNIAGDFSQYGGAIQGQVAEKIQDSWAGKPGAYLYRGAMTAAESGLRAATGKAGTVALSALSGFSQTVSQASAQGASPLKAVALGGVNATIEALSEEIPLEHLLQTAKAGPQSIKELLTNAFIQAGIEASTEEVALVGTTLAEAAILMEQGKYSQQVQQSVVAGKDYQTACSEAMGDLLGEAADTAIVSAISGLGMSAANSVISNHDYKKATRDTTTPKRAPETAPSTDAAVDTEAVTEATPAADTETAADTEATPETVQAPTPEVTPTQQTAPAAEATPQLEAAQDTATAPAVEESPSPKPEPKSRPTVTQQAQESALDTELAAWDWSKKRSFMNAHPEISAEVSDYAYELLYDLNDSKQVWGVDWDRTEEVGKLHREYGMSAKQIETALKAMAGGTALEGNAQSAKIESYILDKIANRHRTYTTVVEDTAPAAQQPQQTTEERTPQQPQQEQPTTPEQRLSTVVEETLHPSADTQTAETARSPYWEGMTDEEFMNAWLDESERNDPRNGIEDPMADRDYQEVGKRNVKAYQYENPEVKPFFQEQAAWLYSELGDTTKGERFYNDEVYYKSGGEKGIMGVKRHTSESIAELLDQYGMSYDQIEKGLLAIMEDNGAENNAASKRIEFVINDRLMNGYTDFYTGKRVPPNQEYLNLLRAQQSAESATTSNVNPAEPTPGIKGTGAAEYNFDGKASYYDLLSENNAQPDRPDDVRPMEVARVDSHGRRVSDFAADAYGAGVTSDSMADRIQELIADGALGFDRQSSEEALNAAREYINSKGKSYVKNRIVNDAANGSIKDGDIEKALLLYADYANKKSSSSQENASEMMITLSMMANKTGRDLNLFKLLRRMTPEGQLMTVQRTVQQQINQLNSRRGKKHQIQDAVIPQQLQQQYLDLSRKAMNSEELVTDFFAEQVSDTVEMQREQSADRAVDSALRKNSEGRKRRQTESTDTREELTPEERVGKRVAETLSRTAKEQNKSQEDILYQDIMVYANDKVRNAKDSTGTQTQNTKNLDALRDYYRYSPFFQTAWEAAKTRVEQTLQEMGESDPRRPVLESFLQGDDPILRQEYADSQSPIRKAVKEAATATGIRIDNHTDSGNQQQVRQKMRDILVENAQSKRDALDKITEFAMRDLNLTPDAADEMARDITSAFYSDLADQSARRLANMFGERANGEKVQKTMFQKLEELFNMGAFSSDEYRTAAFDSVFGEDSGVEIPDSLLQDLTNACETERADVEQAIYAAAAAQIKATPLEKWNTWRYMCMLGSAKTQIRNILGNAGFMPYTEAKRVIGTALEKVILKQDQRTKSLLNMASEADRQLLQWAKADAKNGEAAKALEYSAKLGDDVSMQELMGQRQIFENAWLEKIRKATEWAPSAGDMIFKNHEYAKSLAGFLKARGYNPNDIQFNNISDSVLKEARSYAVEQAMRATFNDSNAFSDMVATRYSGNNAFGKAANALLDGVIPFRRTPANILVRTFENSPMGLIKTALDLKHCLKDGTVSAATVIDDVAANLTGTTAMALGYLLAKGFAGIKLRGSGLDDDEERQGYQAYALEISVDGKVYSYTIDWAAPANLPLFIGANICDMVQSAGGDTSLSGFTAFLQACGTAFEPMMELSCLSSLNDLVDSIKYSDGDAIYSVAAQAATSYLTQGIPSLARQAYQVTQKSKQSTFANSTDPLVRGIQRKAAGIPFVGAAFQTDKITPWGETVDTGNLLERTLNSFFNPGTYRKIDNSALEQEISRLNGSQPENVSPPDVAKKLSYTGKNGVVHKDTRLTEEQYNTLATVQGQTAERVLEAAMSSRVYRSMNDEQKAQVFSYAYDYAREKGRTEAIEGYSGMDSWMENLGEKEADAIIDRVVKSSFSDAFTVLSDSWEYGGGTKKAVKALDQVYSVYSGMGEEAQAAFREENGGRVSYFLDAKDADISTAQFAEMYSQYKQIDSEDLDTSEKAQKWAHALQTAVDKGELTEEQKATLKASMVFRYSSVAETAKFDQMTADGLSPDTALKVEQLMDGIVGTGTLDEETGERSVTNKDKYSAIASSGLSPEDVDIVMMAYMPDYDPESNSPNRTELKYRYAREELGKSPQWFAEAYSLYGRNTKKDDLKAAWVRQGLAADEQESETIYNLFDGNKKKLNLDAWYAQNP